MFQRIVPNIYIILIYFPTQLKFLKLYLYIQRIVFTSIITSTYFHVTILNRYLYFKCWMQILYINHVEDFPLEVATTFDS